MFGAEAFWVCVIDKSVPLAKVNHETDPGLGSFNHKETKR
jgi:hypothetical protein